MIKERREKTKDSRERKLILISPIFIYRMKLTIILLVKFTLKLERIIRPKSFKSYYGSISSILYIFKKNINEIWTWKIKRVGRTWKKCYYYTFRT